jgi:hypothetical protein
MDLITNPVIIAALLSSLITAIIGPEIRDAIRNRRLFRELNDQRVKLVGHTWRGRLWPEQPNPVFPESTVELVVSGSRRIRGDGVVQRGGGESTKLLFTGGFKTERFLILDYKGIKNPQTQFGIALLKLSGNGEFLEGRYLGHGAEADDVVYGRVRLDRVKR